MLIARLRAAAVLACLLLAPCTGARAQDAAIELATLQAPAEVGLPEIIDGRARLGFDPAVGDSVTLTADDRVIWLRVRSRGGPAAQFLRLERQAIDRAQLFTAARPGTPVAETGLALASADRSGTPQSFLLAVPPGADSAGALYVRLEGRGFLYLNPQLLTEAQVAQSEKASAGLSRWVNLLLGLVAIFGLVRFLRQRESGALGVVITALLVALACMATNGELHRIPGGGTLVAIGPKLAPVLWLFACGPLLWSTRRFAGLDKHSPWLSTTLGAFGVLFVALALVAAFLPERMLLVLQVARLAGLALAAVLAIVGLSADPRSARWAAMLCWGGVLAALAAHVLVLNHALPPTLLARRGSQPMLALLLAVYLVLPWAREVVRDRAKLKRAVVPEPTTEEKIDKARAKLMDSLASGLQNASEGDMKWIAYRRLLEELKPVLPQVASAVVAMNYHHEDLLIVEPRDAETRYKMLLQQRGQLFKNLTRARAPQQVSLDFDGPDGPLSHVQLAVIPLPIDRPGWGALLVERNATVEYSETELDLCAEFASLATTIGEEAAQQLEARQANDYDVESGVYRQEVMDRILRQAHEDAYKGRKALAVLRVGFDARGASIRALADAMRDEIDYGETVGRWSADELLVIAPELSPSQVRELGERLLAEARKQNLAVSIGGSSLAATERTPAQMLDRAAQALARVRSLGGNQVQLVAAPGG
jgi:GGDEF domain-containing protein